MPRRIFSKSQKWITFPGQQNNKHRWFGLIGDTLDKIPPRRELASFVTLTSLDTHSCQMCLTDLNHRSIRITGNILVDLDTHEYHWYTHAATVTFAFGPNEMMIFFSSKACIEISLPIFIHNTCSSSLRTHVWTMCQIHEPIIRRKKILTMKYCDGAGTAGSFAGSSCNRRSGGLRPPHSL